MYFYWSNIGTGSTGNFTWFQHFYYVWALWIRVLYCDFQSTRQMEPKRGWLTLTLSNFPFWFMWINWATARPVLDHKLMRRNNWQSALILTYGEMCSRVCNELALLSKMYMTVTFDLLLKFETKNTVPVRGRSNSQTENITIFQFWHWIY